MFTIEKSIKAVAYARFSSDQQREESITAQLRAIEYYASQKGYDIIETYTDKGLSGRSSDRPSFLRMIEDARQGKFEAVIVHKLDRFSRSAADTMQFEEELRDCGVQLISVTEQLDNSPEGQLMKTIIVGMNQFYSQNLAREVRKGLKENAYKCLHNGGTPALGYHVNSDKTYSINEEEAIIVRKIFDLYVNEGWGYKKIINELNDYGYKTKKGQPFGKNSIHEILKNAKYKGVYVFNKAAARTSRGRRNYHAVKSSDQIITVENGVPAIVEAELFDKAQERLAKNRQMPGANKAKEVYLLSGRIYCGECGCLMNGNSRVPEKGKAKYMSYRCNKRDRTKQCFNKEVRREYIESYVLQQLEGNLFNDDIVPVLVARINCYQHEKDNSSLVERERMEKQLADTDKQMNNIVAAIASGMFQPVFKEKMEELQKLKNSLQYRLEAMESDQDCVLITEEMLRSYFSLMKRYVHDRNFPEIKKMVSSYVEKVMVYQDRIDVFYKVALPSNDNSAYRFETDVGRDEVRKCWTKAG